MEDWHVQSFVKPLHVSTQISCRWLARSAVFEGGANTSSGIGGRQAQLAAMSTHNVLHVRADVQTGARLCGAQQDEPGCAVLGKVADGIPGVEFARRKQLARAGKAAPLMADGGKRDVRVARGVPDVFVRAYLYDTRTARRFERHLKSFGVRVCGDQLLQYRRK